MPYFTTADSCKLFYTTYGFETSKPVVIFLNGTTQTTLYWGAHVPVLSKHFCLLFYDARAQGQSDLGMRPLTLQLHVSDLKELMGHLAINKAHLVGLSHGAQVAQAFWGDHPEMVGHIVLCSMGFKTNERARTVIKSWIEVLQLSGLEAMAWAALPIVFGNKFLKQNEKMLDKIVKAVVKRNRKKSLIAHLKAVLNYPPSDGIAYRHSPPMLVISGLEDPIINSADVHQLADFYKARLEELSSIGHSIPAETPHIFERLLIDFLVKSE